MKVYKSIEWAYATSITAKLLNHYNTGCFYISLICEYDNERGDIVHCISKVNPKGYAFADDPDLITQFKEEEGEICPMFLKYGNKEALAALSL